VQKILLGQLGANGDCLYATILARQIRHDHPNAHLTWAISSQCAGLLRNNPHVDEVWEIPVPDWNTHDIAWRVFEREATRRLLRHEFDHAYLSQVWPNNFQNYDGTIRPSILRSYGAPITVPIENVIELDAQELANVESFVKQSGLEQFEHRILFECSAKSGQSFVTPDLAQAIAERLYKLLPSACMLFSTHLPMRLQHPNSRYAGAVTLRESAALTRYGTFFVGAGSGGTVAATSTAAKSLPMLQLLSASTSVYASFAHDFEYFGLPYEHIVEMTDENPDTIARAIADACIEGIAAARTRFGKRILVRFEHYFGLIKGYLLREDRFIDAAQSLLTTVARYGWTSELREFGQRSIAPNLARDPDWIFAHCRRAADEFLTRLHESAT
jgi:6-pyruvoyl-tetrahydropterin synthase